MFSFLKYKELKGGDYELSWVRVKKYAALWNINMKYGKLYIYYDIKRGQVEKRVRKDLEIKDPQELMMLVDICRNEAPLSSDHRGRGRRRHGAAAQNDCR